MPAIRRSEDMAIPVGGDLGALRSAVLEAHLLDRSTVVPAAIADRLESWCQEILDDVEGAPRGLDLAGVPDIWCDTLSWAGVPLARGGELHWDRDCREDATLERPQLDGGLLRLPPPAVLCDCSGLGIKPVRLWIQHHLGVRLQAAPGLRLYVWPSHGLVISHLDIPVGGFLYGPGVGTRMGLTIEPGSWQMVPW